MGAYIINVPSTVDRIIYVHVDANTGKTAVVSQQMEDLTPYTEPDLGLLVKENFERGYRQRKAEDEKDLEQVRKESYDKGYDDATAEIGSDEQAIAEKAYQKGLSDAWEAARKICTNWVLPDSVLSEIFGMDKTIDDIMKESTASEAIEKIRQYEQEKDRQARIEYNFDEIKDVLETTAKECNVSLDEIAEVLQKMKETDNG